MKKPTNKAERDALIKELQAMTFNELPKRWEEMREIKGFYVDRPSEVLYVSLVHTEQANRNVFPTSDQAEASIHLAMLLQLRDVYREGWVPDWHDVNETKHSVYCETGQWVYLAFHYEAHPFSFQTRERAELFLENFEDYLDKVKPLFS